MIAKKRSSSILTSRKFFESLLTFENFLLFIGIKNLDKKEELLILYSIFSENQE